MREHINLWMKKYVSEWKGKLLIYKVMVKLCNNAPENCDREVGTLAPHSGKSGFKSRTWDRIYRSKVFVVYRSPSREIPG